jgi:hypothetical protein
MKLETLDSTSLERIPKVSDVHRGGLKSNRSKNSPRTHTANPKHRTSGKSLESRNSPQNPKRSKHTSSHNRSVESPQNLIPSRANRNKTPVQHRPANPEDTKTAIKQPGVGQYKNSRDSLTPKRSRVPVLKLDIKNINQESSDSDRVVKNSYGYYETGNFGQVCSHPENLSYSSAHSSGRSLARKIPKKNPEKNPEKNLKKSVKDTKSKYVPKYTGRTHRQTVKSGSDENVKTDYDYSEPTCGEISEGSKGRVSKESFDGSYEAEFQYLSKKKSRKDKGKVAFVADDGDRPSGRKGNNFDYGDLGCAPGRAGREQPKGGYHDMRSKIKDISEGLTELRISRSKRREGSAKKPPVESQNPFVAKNTLKRDPEPKTISENKKATRSHYYDEDQMRECVKIDNDGDGNNGNTPKDANSKYRLHRDK